MKVIDAAIGIPFLYDFHGSITVSIDAAIAQLGADPMRCEMILEEPEHDALRGQVLQNGQPVGYMHVFWLNNIQARVDIHPTVKPWVG